MANEVAGAVGNVASGVQKGLAMTGGVAQTVLLIFGGGAIMWGILAFTPVGEWLNKVVPAGFGAEAVAVVALVFAGLALAFHVPMAPLIASLFVGSATGALIMAVPKWLVKLGFAVQVMESGVVSVRKV